jgi:tetratricopeptide (TPR) repeat protein
MQRSDLLQLIEAALAARQTEYVIRVLRRYLADWPGDLGFQFLLARALAADGHLKPALKLLENVTACDPEDFRAQRFYGEVLLRAKSLLAAEAFAAAHVGDGKGLPSGLTLPHWAEVTRTACLAERVGDWETAQRESALMLAVDTPSLSPLPSLAHLCALWHAGQLDLAHPLAEGFHQRWPNVIAFKLCLAECLFNTGGQARALELLHNAAAQDLAGQVAIRRWGEAHPYRALWENPLAITLPGPLPAELIASLGLNRLRGATVARQEKRPPNETSLTGPIASEEVAEIQAQLDTLAARLTPKSAPPVIEHSVLLSSRVRLTQLYGADGFALVDNAIRALAEAQTREVRLRAHVIYVDEAESLKPFRLDPVNPTNAWDIKLLIGQLVEHFKKVDETLGALLIVGGAEVIPFHHLPNPTEDPDPDIPSDNPYATSDDNYFVPEWPVGRIPSGAGNDPALLVRALKNAARHHISQNRKAAQARRGWLRQLWALIQRVLGRRAEAARASASFGYSANIWKSASAVVYDVIGDRDELLTCPPLDTTQLPDEGLAPSALSYFNLHGIEDGPEWYGQRSPNDPAHLPEYPIALRPQDVTNSGRAPVIVFSEACYGANILGKSAENALCLRFLDSGTRALIGSTKVAYGSVSEPLIAADLLGQCFWQNVTAGLPVGEAFRLAKLHMAQEMSRRQGFLDGEDQKTLISFVLYGDPLAVAPNTPASAAKDAKRRALKFTSVTARVPTVESVAIETALTPETVAQIKTLVAQYLPAMKDADLRAARTRSVPASAKRAAARTTVVTLSKTIRANAHTHPHFARVTFDEQGKVIKLAVSR